MNRVSNGMTATSYNKTFTSFPTKKGKRVLFLSCFFFFPYSIETNCGFHSVISFVRCFYKFKKVFFGFW